MDDRTAATTATVSAAQQAAYRGGDKLRTLYPTIDYLRRRASRHIPRFAFEYSDGGAGTDAGIRRNWAGLDAVELVPRYGVMPALPPVEVELFGRKYAAPLGIPPMGGPAIVWPGADAYMAQAAQARAGSLHARHRRRHHHRAARRSSRPTSCGSSSTGWRATTIGSASS